MEYVESVMIVDDENAFQNAWTEALVKQGYPIAQAISADEAEKLLSEQEFGLALVNLKSNGHVRGLDILEWIKENAPSTDVILVTSYAHLEASINALKMGAYDYLVKPVNITEVVTRVNRCMKERKEASERLQVINQIEMMLNQLRAALEPENDDRLGHDQIIETPNIIVDRRKRMVVQNGELISLSPTEFDMLVTSSKPNFIIINLSNPRPHARTGQSIPSGCVTSGLKIPAPPISIHSFLSLI